MPRHIYNCSEGCPVESTLQIISGKWKSVIIYHLIKKKHCRFNELQKLMPNCSRRMLSLQLKELKSELFKLRFLQMKEIADYFRAKGKIN